MHCYILASKMLHIKGLISLWTNAISTIKIYFCLKLAPQVSKLNSLLFHELWQCFRWYSWEKIESQMLHSKGFITQWTDEIQILYKVSITNVAFKRLFSFMSWCLHFAFFCKVGITNVAFKRLHSSMNWCDSNFV